VSAPDDITLYSRPGCHLCEDTREVLEALLAQRASRGLDAPRLVERSIDDDEDLHRRYAFVIPVVAIGGRELELAITPSTVSRFLAEALDDVPQARANA
jgi:hypothetical protein